jgi:hypothetical protein
LGDQHAAVGVDQGHGDDENGGRVLRREADRHQTLSFGKLASPNLDNLTGAKRPILFVRNGLFSNPVRCRVDLAGLHGSPNVSAFIIQRHEDRSDALAHER